MESGPGRCEARPQKKVCSLRVAGSAGAPEPIKLASEGFLPMRNA